MLSPTRLVPESRTVSRRALALVAIFFAVPVLGGFILSLTDFDIYAIGSPETARFVGLDISNWMRTVSIREARRLAVEERRREAGGSRGRP